MPHRLPIISVLMPVYNPGVYLREAIDSILQQTLTDFEFIIVDDCSTDNSIEIIESYRDSRIQIVRNEINSGVAKTLNKGIGLCRGEYIARMDADDIACPDRLEKQLRFMQAHPDVVACGSFVQTIGDKEQLWRAPETDQQIRAKMLFSCPIFHPSAIINRQVLLDHHISYNESHAAEDYDFWFQLARKGRLANINEVLLKYRLHPRQTDRSRLLESANIIRSMILAEALGIEKAFIPAEYFLMFISPRQLTADAIKKLFVFFGLMQQNNAVSSYVHIKALRFRLMEELLTVIKNSSRLDEKQKYLLFFRVVYAYPDQLVSAVLHKLFAQNPK